MTSWRSKIESLVGEIDHHLRDAARSLLGDGPLGVIAYRGYGNATSAHFHGRALECRTYDPSSHTDSSLRNLLNTYRRVDANAIPFAQVAIEFSGRTVTCTADDEGFFAGRIDLTTPLEEGGSWRTYSVELLSPTAAGVTPPKTDGEILVPPKTARFGVISDIDDTVIQSRVNNFLQAARTVMLGNARTRLPFPGVAAFYDALSKGHDGKQQNPVFYVSSSPWNIHDIIVEFMDLQGLPRGPILLRDWDIALGALAATRHFDHKGVAIRRILALYPELPFILIGDTSQHDPEIYRQIVSEFPGRISAVYIRDVNRSPERTQSVQRLAEEILAAKSVLVLAEDTVGAAKDAIERGWIPADALAGIREEKRADDGTTSAKVATPDGGSKGDGSAPTVVE